MYLYMNKKRKNIYGFNHISVKLKPHNVDKLQSLYKYYHRLFKCYQWKYQKLKKMKLSLQLSSITLTVVGTITGSVTLNPIVAGCVVGSGVIIQGYLAKSNIIQRTAQCRLAYTSYEKLLVQLKSYLRGMEYDIKVLLSDIKIIDEMVIDQCPSADDFFKKYDKKFNAELPATELIIKSDAKETLVHTEV